MYISYKNFGHKNSKLLAKFSLEAFYILIL
jgi:hypothetical protein